MDLETLKFLKSDAYSPDYICSSMASNASGVGRDSSQYYHVRFFQASLGHAALLTLLAALTSADKALPLPYQLPHWNSNSYPWPFLTYSIISYQTLTVICPFKWYSSNALSLLNYSRITTLLYPFRLFTYLYPAVSSPPSSATRISLPNGL
jgi:hypothetical protein